MDSEENDWNDSTTSAVSAPPQPPHHSLYGHGASLFPLARILGNTGTVGELDRSIVVRDDFLDRQVGILGRRESHPVGVSIGPMLEEEDLAVYCRVSVT